MVLELEDDIEVVGEASDGSQALARADQCRPDVVLMDVRMPGMDGIEATRALRQSHPEARIIMLSVSDEPDDEREARHAGADGYLLKEVSIEEVADTVRGVIDARS